jgi:alkylation response protein AidB-like acyl-CoA dehydrogenase
MHGMNFAFTEEQEELRKTVRAFLDSKSPETAVRTQMETEQGFDKAVWEQMGSQMGLMGLHIPEEFGGMGFSYVELGVVLEEMGRALVCAPYFATVVLAANTLLQSGDDVAKKKYLPGIAAGETIATLASTEPSGKWDEAGITMAAKGSGAKFTLDGTKMFVIDGHTASLILVAARTAKGVSLFAVDGNAKGLTRTALSTMDQTRKQAKLEFKGVEAELIGTEGKGWEVLSKVFDLAAVALAAEQGARHGGGIRQGARAIRSPNWFVPSHQAQVRRHVARSRVSQVGGLLRHVVCERDERRARFGCVAVQGVLLRGIFPRCSREHPDSRWYRFHLGTPGAPVLQACQVE